MTQDPSAVKQLFLSESCWRDQLGFSLDCHSLYGPDKIGSLLTSAPNGSRVLFVKVDNSNVTRKPPVAAVDFKGKVNGIVSFLTVETDVGRGLGLVRLLQKTQDSNEWKDFTLFTSMHESEGYEETLGSNRLNGVDHENHPWKKNCREQRIASENYEGK